MKNINNLWTEVIPAWLEALGTIGAVVLALFQRAIRNWWNRPKIKVTCGTKEPYVIETDGNTSTSEGDKEMRVRIRIVNEGKYSALYSYLYIDCVYKTRTDGSFYKEEFTPFQVKDVHGSKQSVIAPNLPYFFDVVGIKKHDDMMSADGTGKAKQNYKAFLLGADVTKNLNKGVFVIPLKFYSGSIDPIVTYLKVVWESDTFTRETSGFNVSILSGKEFKSSKTE